MTKECRDDKRETGQSNEKLTIARLTVFSALIYCVCLSDMSTFAHPDEALYGRIAEEMYRAGEWWVPTWFGDLALYKPPFMYWLMMICYHVWWISPFSARIPSALAAIGLVLLTCRAGKILFTRKAALLVALFLSTCLGTIAYGRSGMMDIPMAFLIALSLYFLLLAMRHSQPGCMFLFFLTTGISSLVKGPVSSLIIIVVALVYCALFRRFGIFRSYYTLAGIAVFGFLNILWPTVLYLRGLFQQWAIFFIMRENFGKFGDEVTYTPLVIPGYLLFYTLPWTGYLLYSLAEVFRQGRWKREEYGFLFIWMVTVSLVYLRAGVRR